MMGDWGFNVKYMGNTGFRVIIEPQPSGPGESVGSIVCSFGGIFDCCQKFRKDREDVFGIKELRISGFLDLHWDRGRRRITIVF